MDKDFFEWLFKTLNIDVNYTSKVIKNYTRKNGFKNINRYTRAGKYGKTIYCPVCGEPEFVDNFSWALATCPSCDTTSYKYDWLVKV
jgi:rubrerythrin